MLFKIFMLAKDNALLTAIDNSKSEYQKNGGDFVEIFASNFKELAPTRTLASIFSNRENKQLTTNSTDKEVVEYLYHGSPKTKSNSVELTIAEIDFCNES